MTLLEIHGLREAHVRADGRAEEVENPKCRNNTAVKFPNKAFSAAIFVTEARIFTCRLCLSCRYPRRPPRALDLGKVHLARPLLQAWMFGLQLFPYPW